MGILNRLIRRVYAAAFAMSPRIGMYVRNRTLPWGHPTIAYLEFSLAEHCNMNCAGCLHYAPMAERRLANLESLRRDFARLSELFGNIRQIRIMGGEPLLHPQADEAVRIVRSAFPKSRLSVVTNGLRLLGGLDDGIVRLLAAMHDADAAIDWTVYPPVAGRADEITSVCRMAGVRLNVESKPEFLARVLPKGGAGIRRSFRWCRERFFCPLLDDGRIYTCAPARYAEYYNKAAGTKIPSERGIDIGAASAKDILYYLMCPAFACSFCAEGARSFEWKANGTPSDWLYEKEMQ